MADKTIQLKGRVFVAFNINAVTGMHIGGTDTSIEIGGVDKTVIRDRLTNRPYVPGSSLKGKMRSLLEKYNGLVQNQRIGQGFIHTCDKSGNYDTCDVCQVFGVPGEKNFGTPTRLIVRDVHLTDGSAAALESSAHTDLPYTEVKTEVSIDRVTSAANPRQMERVPAGSVFGPAEMVYSIYTGDECDPVADTARLKTVVEGMQLLEDDYLGGLGSRGSGKIRFQEITLSLRANGSYLDAPKPLGGPWTLQELIENLSDVQAKMRSELGLS